MIKRQGYDGFIKTAIATLPHDLYETAFAVATDLVLADGEVSEEEDNFPSCSPAPTSYHLSPVILRVYLCFTPTGKYSASPVDFNSTKGV